MVISFGKAGYACSELFHALASTSVSLLPRFKPQKIANLAHGYAMTGFGPRFEDGATLYGRISSEVVSRLRSNGDVAFKPVELSMLAHAFAKAGQQD